MYCDMLWVELRAFDRIQCLVPVCLTSALVWCVLTGSISLLHWPEYLFLGPCSVAGHVPTLPWVRSRVRVRVRLGSGLASGKGWIGTWPVTRLDPVSLRICGTSSANVGNLGMLTSVRDCAGGGAGVSFINLVYKVFFPRGISLWLYSFQIRKH